MAAASKAQAAGENLGCHYHLASDLKSTDSMPDGSVNACVPRREARVEGLLLCTACADQKGCDGQPSPYCFV